jgi:hypothetical protein
VTISGSGFGTNQGTGNVILGSALGTVVSWSDAQVSATVANGSVSGIALVQQGGVESNSVSFNVNNASIASVSPTNGLPGTQVTVTGSGFGQSQGNGTVVLGNSPGVVSSWSDGQIVATVAAGSASGEAQVLQSGVWSNAVPFAVNLPTIKSITPNSGSGGTAVTVTGSGFGTSQSNGNVWIGSTYGAVINWGDTQIVASVDPSALSGIVKVSQNGTWSNAVTFTVSTSSGTPLTLVPNLMSMVSGDTRSIQALDSNGNPVTGLAWSSSNTAVATLSTDDPPIITAVAAGNVTITAGSGSADLTVFPGSLPLGTVIWSNPGDGSGVKNIIPAVPSSTGVADVFALQTDGSVQAITSSGSVAWTGNIGNTQNVGSDPRNKRILPDFQGGLIVVDPGTLQSNPNPVSSGSVQKLDGLTGQAYPAYTIPNTWDPGVGQNLPVAVHTDGTIFAVNGDALVGIDPSTGNQKFSISMPHSTLSETYTNGPCSNYSSDSVPTAGNLIIAGDGYAYMVYQYLIQSIIYSPNSSNCIFGLNSTGHGERHVRLLRVGTDGTFSTVAVGDWTQDSTATIAGTGQDYSVIETQSGYIPRVTPNLITNADQGVLLSLNVSSGNYNAYFEASYAPIPCPAVPVCGDDVQTIVAQNVIPGGYAIKLIAVTSGTVTSNVTLPSQISWLQPVLQAQDGTYFGDLEYDWSGDDFLAAFDQSGHIKWAKLGYYAQIATADGGVIAQSYSGKYFTFDLNGNSTGQLASLPTQSWTNGTYAISSTTTTSVALPAAQWETGYAAIAGGNPSNNGTSVGVSESVEGLPVFALSSWGPSCQLGDQKVPLGGSALQQYTNERSSLLAGSYLTSTACSLFFNANPSRSSYFGQLTGGVNRQVPYDGVQTNISYYDAGFLSPADLNVPMKVGIYKKVPVCGMFVPFKGQNGTVRPTGKTTAASQLQPPSGGQATDIYVNTDAKVLNSLKQATGAHEVLHNLTQLYDDDLEKLLGLTADDCIGGTICISTKLVVSGCASTN